MKRMGLIFLLMVSFAAVHAEKRNDLLFLSNAPGPLDLSRPAVDRTGLTNYLAFYGFPLSETAYAGRYETDAGKIFVLVLEPARPRGTVILLHGYLEHSGNLAHPARALLDDSWRVVLFDLPGHGLSDGDRGSIPDFSVYARVLSDIREWIGQSFPGTVSFVGHSTACLACYEMLKSERRSFHRIVFGAPLVRTSWWPAVQAGYFLSPFLPEISRSFADFSGDREYQDYLRFIAGDDPLQVLAVSREWVRALIVWNDRAEQYPILPESVLVIQGDSDSVLDWVWNLEYLQKHFLWPRIEMIPGGKHILFNESARRRKDVLDRMIRYLDG